MAKHKKTFDELARINARVEERSKRRSALPASASAIKGRSRPLPPVIEEISTDAEDNVAED